MNAGFPNRQMYCSLNSGLKANTSGEMLILQAYASEDTVSLTTGAMKLSFSDNKSLVSWPETSEKNGP